jgi:beta-glucosidase
MKGRTYRYFEGKPLYPFGYGLSYTSFGYKDLKLVKKSLAAGEDLHASVRVTNTGKVAGDEVVQLYLKFPAVAGAPDKALRGFKRVHLDAGASQEVQFDLKPRDLSIVTDAGVPEVPAGEFTVTVGGGQPGTDAPTVAGAFKVKKSQTLPE